MRRSFRSPDTLKYTVLAIALMLLVKIFIIDGIGSYTRPAPQEQSPEPVISLQSEQKQSQIQGSSPAAPSAQPRRKFDPAAFSVDFGAALPQPDAFKIARQDKPQDSIKKEPSSTQEKAKKVAFQPYKKTALPPVISGASARIAIIIDDMGMARKYTQDTMALPAPLTLAFLPYAKGLDYFTIPSKQSGHELIIHVPMEPMDGSQNLGPAGLTSALSKEEFMRRLDQEIFTAFDGYVGINNHMGSRLTQNREAMGWVMDALKKRDLFFVDSKTIGNSVAANVADSHGVPYAERDVFLDHTESFEDVMRALGKLESVAKRNGYAIAIGHPKPNTIAALREWMPTMAARNLELVPVSKLLSRPSSVPLAETNRPPLAKASLAQENPIPYEAQ